jgi:Ca-activated chloride channel family protein
MKTIAFAVGLVAGLSLPVFAGETLTLKLEPERDYWLKSKPQEVVVKIDLSAVAHKKGFTRAPLNLAVVLDRSGSMTGAKIEKARQAAIGLVDQLGPADIFSLVAYSDQAQVLVPASEIVDKERLKNRIAGIRPGGRTALHEGVSRGASELEKHFDSRRVNRVILLSDGLANIGPSSTEDLRRLGRRLSERGIAVTTIGVGDDYNEDLMAGLAEASDANYYYVQDTEKLPHIFAKELGELMRVAARSVRIEITCPEGVEPLGFIGRPERFEGRRGAIQFNQICLGQSRYIFLRCRMNRPTADVASVRVSYTDELGDGREQTFAEMARIGLTDDEKLVAKSTRAEVVTQKELVLAAVAKDEALAEADAGRFQQAAQKLAERATVLDRQYSAAPAPLQGQVRQEVENLRQRSQELQQNQYSSSTRKSLQCESWTLRNSKY